MRHIFSHTDIYHLAVVDRLKQLLHERRYDLNAILQSDAVSVALELGVEEDVAKMIINGATSKAMK